MREPELRERIKELAEESAEKERRDGKQRRDKQQSREERRQRRINQTRTELEEQGINLNLRTELDESELEEIEKRREEHRGRLITQGEGLNLPNETPTFIDASTFHSARSNAYNPYYVEVRDTIRHNLIFSTDDPEPLELHITGSRRSANPDSQNPLELSGYVTINWWFSFTPDETRHWDFKVYTPYRGFYSLEVEGRGVWWYDPRAGVKIIEEFRAHQNNAGPKDKRVRLNRVTEDVDVRNRFDEVFTHHYGHLLNGGDSAQLHLQQKFDLREYTKNGGTTELDFGTGSGNKLPVPYVYIR